MPTMEEVTAKYVELRDRKTEIAKRQAEELKPINEAMSNIEAYFLHQMNELGVDSFKTSAGTAYKANQNSVKMTDAGAFKGHVFAPALQYMNAYLSATGHVLNENDLQAMQMILQENTLWDMVDFRVGKKGVMEYFENTHQLPPGVAIDTFTAVNIRRS